MANPGLHDNDVEAMIARRPVVCSECGRQATPPALGWLADRSLREDDSLETVIFCPTCSRREFGGD